MKLLTPRQKRRIRQIVQDRHLALIVSLCGADAIPRDDYERLDKAGMVKLPKKPIDFVTAAHLLGSIVNDATPAQAQGLSPVQFWKMATQYGGATTSAEDEAVEVGRESLAEHIRSMGSKLEHAFITSIVSKHDDLRRRGLTRRDARALKRGIKDRGAVKEIAAALARAAKDTKKDWLRLVHTEIHNHIEEGKAVALLKTGHGDVLVYKMPQPDACLYCKLLYLKPDGTPRIFRLSSLMANGTNVGLKANRPTLSGKSKTEWKATLGALHPWCQCALHYLPQGYGVDSKGTLFEVKKSFIEIESLDQALLHHECTHG